VSKREEESQKYLEEEFELKSDFNYKNAAIYINC
jgi:hypothetical protein